MFDIPLLINLFISFIEPKNIDEKHQIRVFVFLGPWHPALNLYLPALAPNLYLPAPTLNLFSLTTLALILPLPVLFYYYYYYYYYFQSGFSFKTDHESQGLQGKGEDISLTPHYYLHSLHGHLHIRWVMAAESSPLHISSSLTRTGNLWFPSANRYANH